MLEAFSRRRLSARESGQAFGVAYAFDFVPAQCQPTPCNGVNCVTSSSASALNCLAVVEWTGLRHSGRAKLERIRPVTIFHDAWLAAPRTRESIGPPPRSNDNTPETGLKS